MTSGLPSCQVKMPRIGMNGGEELRRSMQRPTRPEVETDENQIVVVVVVVDLVSFHNISSYPTSMSGIIVTLNCKHFSLFLLRF